MGAPRESASGGPRGRSPPESNARPAALTSRRMPTFTIGELLTFVLALLVVAGPAAVLLRAYAPNLPVTDGAVLGTLAGMALYIVALNYVDPVHGAITMAVAGSCLIAATLIWKFNPRARTRRATPEDVRYERLLVALMVVQFALLLVTAWRNPLPIGNDPVYHVAISDKLVRAGTVPDDFLPYDPVAPTYTLGSHLLVAFGSLQTALPVHRLYQFALPLFLVLMTGALFHTGRIAFGSRAGFFGAFVFAFLANWGSLDLMRWGSLPNAAGMAFFLAAARLLAVPVGRVPVLLPALFIGAMAATHHLSALIFALVSAISAAGHLKRNGLRAAWMRQAAGAWIAGVLLVLPGVWRLASEIVRSLRSSEQAALDAGVPYLNVVEPVIPAWEIPGDLGIVLFGLAVAGVWIAVRDRSRPPLTSALLTWTMAIAGAFVGLDWVLRWIVEAVWRQDLAILTPSRFLTDLSYPLCLFAGAALAALWRHSRKVAGLIVAAAPCYALWMLLPLIAEQIPRDELAGLIWFSKSSPENSLLLQAPLWTTYVSGREGDLMVLREERLSDYTDRKRTLASQGSGAVEAWMRAHQRPVYLWETRDLAVGNLEKVWDGDQAFIYRFIPRP